MMPSPKSSVEQIRAHFDGDVERFSNLDTGQVATVDAALCLNLVAHAAASVSPHARAILDIGCGAGNSSLKLRERLPDARFTLVDLSRPMLDRASQRLADSVHEVRRGDIHELDFAPESFDVILAAEVVEHGREEEDTPAPLGYQLDRLRHAGFSSVDVLHKNGCFAAFGGVKRHVCQIGGNDLAPPQPRAFLDRDRH